MALFSFFFLPKNTRYKTFKLYGNQELLSPGNMDTGHRARWMARQRTEGKSDNIHTHNMTREQTTVRNTGDKS